MLSSLPVRTSRALCSLPSVCRRTLATHVPALTASGLPSTDAAGSSTANGYGTEDGPLRPHLGIQVNPNHGLYAFFRRKEEDGKVSYETVERVDISKDKSGAFYMRCGRLCLAGGATRYEYAEMLTRDADGA